MTNSEQIYIPVSISGYDISNNYALKSDLETVYKTSLKQHTDLEIYIIDALNSIKDYRHFFKYPISREELPKYIEYIYKNNYYIDKYSSQRKLLYVINIFCIIIICLALIKQRFSFLDELAYSFILGFILAVMFIYILYQLWDIFLRNNFIYNKYDFEKYGEPSAPLPLSNDRNCPT